jgi:hypothetical protein
VQNTPKVAIDILVSGGHIERCAGEDLPPGEELSLRFWEPGRCDVRTVKVIVPAQVALIFDIVKPIPKYNGAPISNGASFF